MVHADGPSTPALVGLDEHLTLVIDPCASGGDTTYLAGVVHAVAPDTKAPGPTA
jgi:hypothetical protein